MRTAVVIGTGQVGRAATAHLAAAGWDVRLVGRDRSRAPASPGVRFVVVDRSGLVGLRSADLVVDTVCFTADDARAAAPLMRRATSAVMISTKAVYVDAGRRHSNADEPPDFGGPIVDETATLPAGHGDPTTREGYGRNKVAAEQVLLESGAPVTVLRPSKIHGRGARPSREWFFVRRALDGRGALVLGHRGMGVDHPTAALNIATLVAVVADRPAARVLNVADADAPDVRAIAAVIGERLGHRFELVPLAGAAPCPSPWDAVPPRVLDTSKARVLGWEPKTYAESLDVDWLVHDGPGEERLPERLFDYAAEELVHLSAADT